MPSALTSEQRRLGANTLRILALDAVEKAQSGHPGLPMGAADYAFTLWSEYLRFNPKDPAWPSRDRFILSAGHGSMLLYSLLHLFGYDVSLEDLEHFRQWGSKTPGHPEYGITPGVETTTGPLGQGLANAVGMAIAAKMTAARYNTASHRLFDHTIYCLASDGDLMEGVASEAASLAGHLGLGNLIVFYDDNRITIEGATDLAFTEDRAKRFEAYGWQVLVIDGHDGEAAPRAIEAAQAERERPTLIVARTHIAYGSPTAVDTAEAHGTPLGAKEVAATKANLGWPQEPTFYVPEEVRQICATRVAALERVYESWQREYRDWRAANPELAAQYDAATHKTLPDDLEGRLLMALGGKAGATRRLGGEAMAQIASLVPNLVGGSADLAPSTSTYLKGYGDIAKGDFSGRNFHFGVREHAMGAVLNGMALYGGYIPFGATFLVFADYMRPPIRLACLMGLQVIYVFTHDSIFVGEDGPTHQPVEQMASLRLIPGMTVIRPADGAEVAAAWAYALRHRTGPTALIFTRQNVPPVKRQVPFSIEAFNRGAYIVAESPGGTPDVVIIGTGSELPLALAAQGALEERGYAVRILSMPSREILLRQDKAYREALLPPSARKVVIEAGTSFGWGDLVGPEALFITQDTFGHSAPYQVLAEAFGFTPEKVTRRILDWLENA